MITGTFLDEISIDIPSANWGPEEWTRDFATMKADGIDTVVLARGGYSDRGTFRSEVLRKRHPHLIVQADLAALFISLAEQYDMSLWFGTYDSGAGQSAVDVDLGRAFADEVWERYGRSRAFRGWSISHEVDTADEGALRGCHALSKHLRQLAALPVLVSPRLRRSRPLDKPTAWTEHEREWSSVFASLEGVADVVALQTGSVPSAELPDFLAINARLAKARHLTTWANVETFDRDVHIKYPPIAWPKLRSKMEASLSAGVDKLITFEYSHFLSPNSMFNSGHALHKRYREWLATQK